MEIKRHKKSTKWAMPWPRKQISKHTSGKCPYCKKKIVNNLESHIDSKHKSEKRKELKGIIHGHD